MCSLCSRIRKTFAGCSWVDGGRPTEREACHSAYFLPRLGLHTYPSEHHVQSDALERFAMLKDVRLKRLLHIFSCIFGEVGEGE